MDDIRIATDEEYRRKLGLMLPKKLLDSFSDYLLNDFHYTGEYYDFLDEYERLIGEIKTGKRKTTRLKQSFFLYHNPDECPDCKFVMESIILREIKREFLCCEKYYASIKLKLLKMINRKMETQMHSDGSFSYKTTAHTMFYNILNHSDAIWGMFSKHEFYDEDKFKDRDNAAVEVKLQKDNKDFVVVRLLKRDNVLEDDCR